MDLGPGLAREQLELRQKAPAVFAGALVSAGISPLLMAWFPHWFSVWFWPIGFFLALAVAVPVSLLAPPPDGPVLTWKRVMRDRDRAGE